MSEQNEIKKLRDGIDSIDAQIIDLLNERVRIAQAIARHKSEDPEGDFYRPAREAQVLRTVMERNQGPLSDEAVAGLFREIMSAALAAESPVRIAYLGPEGTYSHAAALKHFGKFAGTLPHMTLDDVFQVVEKGEANYGVVPVENSIEGVVTHTLDKFLDTPLKILGEVHLRIRHQLLSNEKSLEQVSVVYAHNQSLAQCRSWLGANLPAVRLEAVSSNAEAARQVKEHAHAAAIASTYAGELYELEVLAGDIEDNPRNTTRFLVIGNQSPPPSGSDKTSLIVASQNQPGALHRLLTPFAEHGISMTRIESRPSRQALWEYVFFIDIEGHQAEAHIRDTLKELENESAFLKILGSYPVAVL
jgi:chorismate mutase/prephenate dehydratase